MSRMKEVLQLLKRGAALAPAEYRCRSQATAVLRRGWTLHALHTRRDARLNQSVTFRQRYWDRDTLFFPPTFQGRFLYDMLSLNFL